MLRTVKWIAAGLSVAAVACSSAGDGSPPAAVGTVRSASTCKGLGWHQFTTASGNTYCADGADTALGRTTQHVAVSDNRPYIMSCKEVPDGNGLDSLLQWYNPSSFGSCAYDFCPTNGGGEFMSATPTGNVWVANVAGNIYLWQRAVVGGSWTAGPLTVNDPNGPRYAYNIAAVSDSSFFVLANPAGSDSCPGGMCIWQATYTSGGASYNIVGDSQGVTRGAIAIAWDSHPADPNVSGKLWRVDDAGDVWALDLVDPYTADYEWTDHGTNGLPPKGAVAIAVNHEAVSVIADATTTEQFTGGPIFYLGSGNYWVEGSGFSDATDLAFDATTGGRWVVRKNGPLFPGQGGDKNLYWYGCDP
jgi:hypothetical protein